MPKCAMDLDCQAIVESQKRQDRTLLVDIIRECVRNAIGFLVILGVMWILYSFVVLSPVDDRKDVMFLVIGYLGGLATGVSTWFFGGAMRSAFQQANLQPKGGTSNVPVEAFVSPVSGPVDSVSVNGTSVPAQVDKSVS